MHNRVRDEKNAIEVIAKIQLQLIPSALMYNQPGFYVPFPEHPKVVERQGSLTTKFHRSMFCDNQHTGVIASHIKLVKAGNTPIDLKQNLQHGAKARTLSLWVFGQLLLEKLGGVWSRQRRTGWCLLLP
jgi:hypothetical protein